ncbi:hypothetical protein Hamer_G011520 [Homarus americanus]|uniref:Uncharacterized protein n=1 Tax=Homarus americanus TaxID=6706 RepID=A0A8J5K7F9_HOMAM|nr:hypothetical protein Hamer_G011520 [Homarus americanus]
MSSPACHGPQPVEGARPGVYKAVSSLGSTLPPSDHYTCLSLSHLYLSA